MSPSSAQEKMKGLQVAVVGLGRMGMRHLQAVRTLGMTVRGIADTSTDALEAGRLAAGVDAECCFADARAMLREIQPDAVVVATTAPSHCELVLEAASAGARYILCEKPMAASLAEARSMVAACKESGAALAVNHQMRFMPHYQHVKELVGTEVLGPLASVLVAGSNFGLAMNGSHYFEMFRYVAGEPIASVRAILDEVPVPNPRGEEFEDRAGRILARGASGAALYIDFVSGAGHGLQVIYICREGQISVDELTGSLRVSARKPEFRGLPTTRYGMPAEVRQFDVLPTDTLEPTKSVWSAMMSGAPYPDGDAGLHALSCLVAAHASHDARGQEIRIDDPVVSADRVFAWA